MYKKGTVLSSKNGELKIKITSDEAAFCDKCSIKGICSQNENERVVKLKYKKEFPEGSEVLIKTNELFSIILAFLIFILPLLIFIISVFLLQRVFMGNLPYMISVIILIAYFLIITIFQNKLTSFVEILEAKRREK